jgi:hypothetical protein
MLSAEHPDRLWSPLNHHIQTLPADDSPEGERAKADIGVNLTFHSQMVSSLRMSGVLALLPHISSWPPQGQRCL